MNYFHVVCLTGYKFELKESYDYFRPDVAKMGNLGEIHAWKFYVSGTLNFKNRSSEYDWVSWSKHCRIVDYY